MAITFPSSPSPGDIFTSNGKSWQYVNGKWEAYGEIIAPDVFSVDEVNDVVNVYGSLAAGASASIASDLVVDTNTLVVDSTNNRVGVGTSTPTKQVSVESNSTNIFNVDSTTAFDPFLGENVTSPRVGIGVDNPSNELEVGGNIRAESVQLDFNGVVSNTGNEAVTLRGVDSSISFRTSGSENVVIDGSGNVGIGTTSPANPLEIYGGTADAVLHVGSGDAGSYITFADSTTTGAYWRNRIGINGNDLRFDTDFTNRMTITSSGNVGIGTTSPGALLHVSSGTSGDAEIRIQADTDNNDENDNPILTFMQDGAYFAGVIGMTNNVLNIVNSTNSSAGIKMGVVAANSTSGQDAIASMTTPALEITPANNVKMNGDLTVFGSIYHDVSGATSSDPVIWIDAENIDVPLIRVGTDQWSTSGDHGFTIQYNGAGAGDLNSLSILADNQTGTQVNALTITQSGNIGIGNTTDPAAKVEISSSSSPNLYLRMSTNGSGARIQFSDQSTEAQKGYMTYYHADGSSYGHGNAFVFDSTEATFTVVSTDDFTAVGTLTQNYSDERLKTIHGTIPDALAKLSGIRGYLYTQNETADSLGFKEVGVQQVGVSAQEVMAVMPEVVAVAPISYTDKTEEEYYTVRYERMVPLLVEAIHALTARIEALEAG